ncbi:MAG: YihY/virulence factor BrkB family protein [Bryobacteraceae bacterium]|nr:YihY/virulence factor BrkB family protein [Bryobacteraceae bacterium]
METIETTGIHDRQNWRIHWRRFKALRWKDTAALLDEVWNNWTIHNVPRLGASVAFYTLLSLAPLLIVVVAVAGAVFGREAAEGQIVWQIQDLVGRAGAETVQTLLRSTQHQGAGAVASVLGTFALILGATAAVSELRDALNTIWCVPRKQMSRIGGLVEMAREKTFAFATVLGIGLLLLVSLAFNATLSVVSAHYQRWLPHLSTSLLQWADFLVSWIVIAGLFALIYKLLPDLYLEWGDVIPGALITSVLFSVGRLLIGLYLGRASYASVYGAAGSIVVVLVWVYYSAQIFFFGAEFTRAYAQTFGSKPCDRIGKEIAVVSATAETNEAESTPQPKDEPLIRLS